ncbi:D-beta-hydroxybutyrate dehydrogenase, mitochondrial-like isoform X2 [Penaeus monodon]|uniref:D-beta-hydroxybutyrate dehydrogenase, mitochondrial-like isoform X2 n=1 Tax=Penaeus monodon TaxID=6687 RepID=UPI0018A784E1|nr:D-beta-hydroxybutyrate dehydrogenase, mitochondrial-like isoform X2 [Penaeus monodon]
MTRMLWTWDKTDAVIFQGVLCAVVSFLANTATGKCCWALFFALWGVTSAACIIVSALQVSPKGRAVLITGCDSGFGLALALHLDKLGFRVFAGCLLATGGGEGSRRLRREGSERLHVLQLDVTSPEQIRKAVEEVNKKMPKEEQFWGLVNNAGWATYGELEWVTMDTFRRITDINVFGILAMTKAFLPMIRRSKGRVVNISSGLARMAVPMRSPYVLSKYAVEGLSDVLRYEMKTWGVGVSLIEPGNYIAGTSIFTEKTIQNDASRMWNAMSEDVRADYGRQHFEARVGLMRKYATGGMTDLMPVINAYTEALLQRFPQPRYKPMNFYFRVRLFIATHLPEVFYDNIYIDYLRK